jgi:hypothetical protein
LFLTPRRAFGSLCWLPHEKACKRARQGDWNLARQRGRMRGKQKKILNRGNEPKDLLMEKELAFFSGKNELVFECKKRPTNPQKWPRIHSLCGNEPDIASRKEPFEGLGRSLAYKREGAQGFGKKQRGARRRIGPWRLKRPAARRLGGRSDLEANAQPAATWKAGSASSGALC